MSRGVTEITRQSDFAVLIFLGPDALAAGEDQSSCDKSAAYITRRDELGATGGTDNSSVASRFCATSEPCCDLAHGAL